MNHERNASVVRYNRTTEADGNLSRTLRIMEEYGLVVLKKNVREIEPIALATSFKKLIG